MKLSITDLQTDDRPREKFMRLGASHLSEAELLAILIGSGNTEENAVQLMQRMLTDCGGSLNALGRMHIDDLCRYRGMGSAKAITLLAACELGRRRMSEEVKLNDRFDSAENVYRYFLGKMQHLDVEECRVMLLNTQLRYVADCCLSRGGIGQTVVDIRLALKQALLHNATRMILCHNHPTGVAQPSADDDHLTQKLKRAAETLDLRLLDHVIVADAGYYSYAEHGRL